MVPKRQQSFFIKVKILAPAQLHCFQHLNPESCSWSRFDASKYVRDNLQFSSNDELMQHLHVRETLTLAQDINSRHLSETQWAMHQA